MKGSDICDGFGNSWSRCKLGADCGLHVVRPGKARCWCEDQEASREKVQGAREEIAKLEADNERLREEAQRAKIDRDLAGWDDYAVIAELKRENAAERARLDSGQILLTVAGERVWYTRVDLRAAIDAAMKEAQP